MVNMQNSVAIYSFAEAVVYKCKIPSEKGADTSKIVDTVTKDSRLLCSGQLRIVDADGKRFLIVGPGNEAKFICQLPAAICVLNKGEMTCASVTDNTFVLISLVNVDVAEMDKLADLLADLSCVVRQPRYDDNTERWAKRTRNAASGVGWAIREASLLAGKGIDKAGEMTRNNTARAETETEISPSVQKALDRTKSVSEAFAKGVDYLLTGAVAASKFVVVKTANGFVSQDATGSPQAERRKTFAESAVSATVEVLDSFSDAKTNLFRSAKDATVKTVDHRYGAQAATAAGSGMDISENVADVAFLAKPSSILKKVVKGTAKGAAEDALNKPVNI